MAEGRRRLQTHRGRASSTAVIEKIARAAAVAADDLFGDLGDEQIRKLARTCLVAKLEAAMHSAIRK